MKHTVLVIDDDTTIAAGIRALLDADRYQVDQARDGQEAMEKIRRQSYEVVILDLVLREMNGLDLVDPIRQARPEARIITLTGYSSVATAVESLKSGCCDYLEKPCTPEDLIEAVEKAIAAR